MSSRRIRIRQNRVIVGASLAVSAVVHGVLLGTLTFQVPQSPSEAPDGMPEPVVVLDASIEVVQIEEVRREVIVEPILAQARPALATPTPEQLPQPAPGERSVAKAGEAPPSDAVMGSDVLELGDAFPSTTILAETGSAAQLAVAMTPRFGAMRELPELNRRPIAQLEPLAGLDQGVGNGREEETFWQRLGRKFGFGGSEICRPRPELIVEEDKPDEDKPDKDDSKGS